VLQAPQNAPEAVSIGGIHAIDEDFHGAKLRPLPTRAQKEHLRIAPTYFTPRFRHGGRGPFSTAIGRTLSPFLAAGLLSGKCPSHS
jgi:hypothetical protein